jgi:hypothetical protein
VHHDNRRDRDSLRITIRQAHPVGVKIRRRKNYHNPIYRKIKSVNPPPDVIGAVKIFP